MTDIILYGIYVLKTKEKDNEIVEVTSINEEDKAIKVHVCNEIEINEKTVSPKELSPLTLTEKILKALSFQEKEGQLYGIHDEHFFVLKKDNIQIIMTKKDGVFHYVQPSPDLYYGCKYNPMPYLHQLQKFIGTINAEMICKIQIIK